MSKRDFLRSSRFEGPKERDGGGPHQVRVERAVRAMRRTGWTLGQGWFRKRAPLDGGGRFVFEIAIHWHLTAYVEVHGVRLHDSATRALRGLGFRPHYRSGDALYLSRPIEGFRDPDGAFERVQAALKDVRPSPRRPGVPLRKVFRPRSPRIIRRALDGLLSWAAGADRRGWDMGFGVNPEGRPRKGVQARPMLHWSEGELSVHVDIAAPGADRPAFADAAEAELRRAGYEGEWFPLPWEHWAALFRRRFNDPAKAVAEALRRDRWTATLETAP